MYVIIVGGGRTVYFVARQFVGKGYQLAIISKNEDDCQLLARQFRRALILHGDGSDPRVIEDAGAHQADVLLALTPHDQDNLIACQIAQQMFGVPRTVAVVNDPDNEAVFRQLGVTTVFSTSRILGMLIEEQTGFDEITNLFPVAEGRITVTEVPIRQGAPALARSLAELELPEGSLVAGIIRGDTVIVPRGGSTLERGDRVLLISRPEQIGDALRILVGEEV